MGSYPIVQRGMFDTAIDGLPVLLVDSYDNLTPELLQQTYAQFAKHRWDYSRLYVGFYHMLLGHYRFGYNKRYRIRYFARSNPQ